jgi:hypothetical protein
MIDTGGTGFDMFSTAGGGSYYGHRAGGPVIEGITFQGIGPAVDASGYPLVGVGPDGRPQLMNGIHSDFGMLDTTIRGATSTDAGPHAMLGLMSSGPTSFFNGGVGQPGPTGCTFDQFTMTGYGSYPWKGQPAVPTGRVQANPPAYGGFAFNTSGMPIALQVSGALSVQILAVQPIGNYPGGQFVAPLPGGPNRDTYAVPIGAVVYIGYGDPATVPIWHWRIAPNIFNPAFAMAGGSVAATTAYPAALGNAADDTITNLHISGAAQDGIVLYDTVNSTFSSFTMADLGMTGPSNAISNLDSMTPGLGATGSTGNVFQTGDVGGTLYHFYDDNGPHNWASIVGVRFEIPAVPEPVGGLRDPVEHLIDTSHICADQLQVTGTSGAGAVLVAPLVPPPDASAYFTNPFDSPVQITIGQTTTNWWFVTEPAPGSTAPADTVCKSVYYSPSLGGSPGATVALRARESYRFYYYGGPPPTWTWTTP